MEVQTTKIHAALLASPGIGHLVPVLELGKRLVTQLDFQVTIFVVGAEPSVLESQLQNFPKSSIFNVVSLPPVDISGLVDPNASIVTKIIVMMRESVPDLRSEISVLKLRPTVLIVDLFGTEALRLADELNMLNYVLIASNAWFLAATTYFPTIDGKQEDEHIIQQKPLIIPGCKPVRFEDTLEAFLVKNDELYLEYLRIGLEIPAADGILVNTWEDLEAKTLQSMRDTKMLGRVTRVPIYPIGPLVREVKSPALENPVLDWLDNQPTESVIYVSFGSGGTLSAKQMTELAWGLELSQQRFIWVIRPPVENDTVMLCILLGRRKWM
ncbi:hypothetical protein Pint_28230 [Pistacia integerrima]|uniref:Uncharacterized protein n=1 Tax=Pistacia integerrima TaxID=434235 RepID=A0ACC0YSW0_9ROSI|nr:hypothetical protein Pint_28230 [Pistacia integerrima]